MPGQHSAVANEENSEIEMEQEVECGKKESKRKGALTGMKAREEDVQQMEGKECSLKFFQMAAPS